MLTRTEFIEPSIRTFSFSFRLIITGVNSNSLLDLKIDGKKLENLSENEFLGVFSAYFISTSGLLCRSTTCDEKLSKHKAAVNVCRTAAKYGFNVAL